MTIVAAALAGGCAPGHIAWDGGEDVLRTALWVDTTSVFETGGSSRWLFLSNGIFACDLPAHDDPADQELAYLRLQASAMREDARHLLFFLEGPEDVDWEGPWELATGDERAAKASYTRVDEVARSGGSPLGPTYEVTEGACHLDGSVSGFLEVDAHDDEVLEGTFDLSALQVSGRFSATRCGEDAALIHQLPWALAVLCPGR